MKSNKKWLILSVCLILFLCGCSVKKTDNVSKNTENTEIKENQNNLKQISLDEISQLNKNNESFIIIATISDCKYCAEYKNNLAELINNFDYDIYELSVNNENKEDYEMFLENHPYDEENQEMLFPSTMIYKNGSFIVNSKGVLSKSTFIEWIDLKMD